MAEHEITEKIEFLTQIHVAWDGTEQRMALREFPRRTLSYRYTGIQTWDSFWIRALAYCKQGKQIQFPVWHSETELKDKVIETQRYIKINPIDIWGYRDCNSVMLWDNDDVGGRVYKINDIQGNGIVRLSRAITKGGKANITRAIPVCSACVIQATSVVSEHSGCTDGVINVEILRTASSKDLPYGYNENEYPKMKFEYSQNADYTWSGLELFLYPPQWVEGTGNDYAINADRLDNNTGAYYYAFKSASPTTTKNFTFLAKDKEELHYLERFFYRCKGKLHSFYMPTWDNDIEMIDDIPEGSREMFINLNIYYKYYDSITRRKTICIFYNDDTMEILEIAGYAYSDDGNNGKVFLKTPITHDIDKNKVRMISFLLCVRFDDDAMTINHETTENVAITFPIVEVDL